LKERTEVQFAFVPHKARRTGWVTFTADPRAARRLSARPVGYESP